MICFSVVLETSLPCRCMTRITVPSPAPPCHCQAFGTLPAELLRDASLLLGRKMGLWPHSRREKAAEALQCSDDLPNLQLQRRASQVPSVSKRQSPCLWRADKGAPGPSLLWPAHRQPPFCVCNTGGDSCCHPAWDLTHPVPLKNLKTTAKKCNCHNKLHYLH